MRNKLLHEYYSRVRDGTVQRVWLGPYRGLYFVISPAIRMKRTKIFHSPHEPEVTKKLTEILRPNMIVFDIGAHIGIHALYIAAMLGSRGKVVAFEPFPENFHRLQRNVAVNSRLMTKIVTINQAVADTVGFLEFTRAENDGEHHLTRADEEATLSVETVTLDQFCHQSQEVPEVILIDTEGAELQVLQGSQNVIEVSRPQLIIEHHMVELGEEYKKSLVEWLMNHQYDIEQLGSRHFYAK